jgi:uncharacterized protein YndB with AHSA1/START domain
MHTETPQLAISRVFDAPRELVYRAFTDPDHLAARWGPIGNSLPRDRTTSVAAGRRARHTTAGEGGSHIRLGSGEDAVTVGSVLLLDARVRSLGPCLPGR